MLLRPYQLQAAQAVFSGWKESRSELVVMPTGTGKTILFSAVIKDSKKRAMVLCERRELVWQTAKKIREVTGLTVEVEMGEYKSSQDSNLFGLRYDVIVSSIQTQCSGGDGGRMGKFDPKDFGLVVVDECHHSTAKSYQRALDYYKSNPDLKVLGVTATPDRTDEEALGQVFEHVAFEYPLYDEKGRPSAIRDGWLVPIVQQFVSATLDLSSVRTTAGELNGADLAAVLEAEKPMHEMVEAIFEIMHGLEPMSLYKYPIEEWKNHVKGIKPKRAIAFTQFVNHARMLSDILNRIFTGISAYVHGGTEEIERKKIIEDFKNGKGASVLCNCNVISEGYDDDGVEIVFMCAPTKSRARYAQRIGRGTRPHGSIVKRLAELPNAARRRFEIANSCKPHVLVIDFVGNSGKHKLIYSADILGGNVSDEVIDEAVKTARKTGNPVPMAELLEEEEKRIEERKKREAEENARRAKLVGKATYKMQNVDPFDLIQVKPVRSRGWDSGKVLSPKQMEILRKAGFNPTDFDYSKGSQLVGIILSQYREGTARFGQIKLLKKFGIDAREMKFDKAREAIDAIKANGWRRPADINLPKIETQKQPELDDVPF